MTFLFFKLVWLLVSPDNLLVLTLGLGTLLLFTTRRRAGRLLVGSAALAALVVLLLPVGDRLLRPLENRFPPPDAPPRPVHGIVVLGGGQDQWLTQGRGQPALNAAAERLTEAVALARRHPAAKVVFTGGSGNLLDQNLKEADTARAVFESLGLSGDRVLYEAESRDTWENALFAMRLVRPGPAENWLLVTSAAHMPRAVGAFRQAGWRVIPWPVDYETLPEGGEPVLPG